MIILFFPLFFLKFLINNLIKFKANNQFYQLTYFKN